MNFGAMSSWMKVLDAAIQAWPVLKRKFWLWWVRAFSMFASGKMRLGDLPPSSRTTRFRLLVIVSILC